MHGLHHNSSALRVRIEPERRAPSAGSRLTTVRSHLHSTISSLKTNVSFLGKPCPCRASGIPCSAAAEAQPSVVTNAKETATDDVTQLERFLSWLVANGVKGIGQADSKVALLQWEHGERGLTCEERIYAGEVVLEVPLRLALTDHSDDLEANQLMYPGAPWSVRLACKLLRHVAAGDRSPWAPYINVLPRHVPAPLECFSWEDLSSLRYPPLEEALHCADWLRSDALQASTAEARGILGEQMFYWALSVVHSRTFANAASGGGVGVRMLVPLVDMLNHGGDVVVEREKGGPLGVGLGGGRVVATDTVRWDLLPPDRSSTGGWSMAVTAVRDMQPGQEILLSYGERPNDDFFLHYGFVPRANPHDEAVLWPDLESALDWHYERLGQETLSPEEAEPLYMAALEVGRGEQRDEALRRPQRADGGNESTSSRGEADGCTSSSSGAAAVAELPPEISRQLAQIKVAAGGQVSAAAIRAFAAVSGGDTAAAERAVALRCAELLWNMAGGFSSESYTTTLPVTAAANSAGDQSDASSSSNPEALASPHATVASSGEGQWAAIAGKELGLGAGLIRSGGSGGGILVELATLLADADPRVLTSALTEKSAEGFEVEPMGDEARYWWSQLRGYFQVLLPGFADLLPEGTTAVATAVAATTAESGWHSNPASTRSGDGNVVRGNKVAKYGLPSPLVLEPSENARLSLGGERGGSGGGGETTDGALRLPPLGALVRALLPNAARNAAAVGESAVRLTRPQQLCAAFRCSKQMVLWDVLLSCSVSPRELAGFVRGIGRGG